MVCAYVKTRPRQEVGRHRARHYPARDDDGCARGGADRDVRGGRRALHNERTLLLWHLHERHLRVSRQRHDMHGGRSVLLGCLHGIAQRWRYKVQ